MYDANKTSNHLTLNYIINSKENEEIFKNHPSVRNYLKLLDSIFVAIETYSKEYDNFTDSIENSSNNIQAAVAGINNTSQINARNIAFSNLNNSLNDMNSSIEIFNKAVFDFNEVINRFLNFNELSADEITYYNNYFNINIDNLNVGLFNLRNEHNNINASVYNTSIALNKFSTMLDVALINHFFNVSSFKNNNQNQDNVLSFIEYVHISDAIEDSINTELEESGLNDVLEGNTNEFEESGLNDMPQVNSNNGNVSINDSISIGDLNNQTHQSNRTVYINQDSEELISTLPGFNMIMAKRVVESREKGIYFSSIDNLAGFLNLKPHIIHQLEPLVSFDMENETIKMNPGRKLDIDNSNNSNINNSKEDNDSGHKARRLEL